MKKEFVPYDRALRMKQLGFDNIPCLAVWYNVPKMSDDEYEFFDFNNHFSYSHYETQYYAQKGYNDGLLAPTWQSAFRWFRDEYYINEVIHCGHLLGEWTYSFWSIPTRKITDKHIIRDNAIRKMNKEHFNAGKYKTREEAELACLDKLLEIVEQKQKENEQRNT